MVNGTNSSPRLFGKRTRGRRGKRGGPSKKGHQQQPLHQVELVAVALQLEKRIVILESALPKVEKRHHQSAIPNVHTWTQPPLPNHQQQLHRQRHSSSEGPNDPQYPPDPGGNNNTNNNRNSNNVGHHKHHLHHNYHRQRHRRSHGRKRPQMPQPGRQQVKVITRRT